VSHEDQDDRRYHDSTAAVTRAPEPASQRGSRLHAAVRRVAITSAWLLLIVAGVTLLGYVLGRLWAVVLLPVVLGLLVSTVLWPAVRFLRSHRWPAALAAITALVTFVALLAGVVLLVIRRWCNRQANLPTRLVPDWNRCGGGLPALR
jgi:predicted PurR-regulated permease PerM